MHGSHRHDHAAHGDSLAGGHGHAHGHGHSHAPADFGRAFAIGVVLNLGFVLAEGIAGLLIDSMALLADAGHNLSDVLGLLIAWAGASLAKRPASPRFTYGLSSSTILAALANAVLLLFAAGAIALEAVRRFNDPPPIAGGTVMAIAFAGILVNFATAMLFVRGRKDDINVRGAYLHMLADAAVSAGVVVAGAIIWWTGAQWIDPAIGLVIVAVILWSTWDLGRDSLAMALHAVPPGIDPERVQAMLAAQRGVSRVHDLHIWPMSTTQTALTAHLMMPAGHPGDAFLAELQHALAHDHGIGHATLQIEIGDSDDEACRLHDAHG
ncbi:cation diffusion facilitator family transporter [Sphingomonas sp.]|uniref:cation diffusion facilitator family transporter n=1 Tax=Sphingomonas sp. TaxID=28214 RepID=UPI001ED441FE|nr:cation diffusion facilitator family transporter [Sphingomonas sp.]MBX3594254.1 cation transporter [Sphingomonas sp.]